MRGFLSLGVLSTFLPLALAAPPPLGSQILQGRASKDAQSSLTLDKSQVQSNLKKDGQQVPAANQVASLTSSNNFINFCLTQKVPLTNGQQVKKGSCNPTPMGRIVSQEVMPTSKFVFPPNLDESLVENQTFTVQMLVANLQTGNFVNAQSNYFGAPAQVNDKGHLIGHSHIVIQEIPSLTSTKLVDPQKFVFFQGLNAKAENSILSAKVTGGLPAGVYRMGSINSAANHQPALVAVAQHGMLDDIVYFTVKKASQSKGNMKNGKGNNNNTAKSSSMMKD